MKIKQINMKFLKQSKNFMQNNKKVIYLTIIFIILCFNLEINTATIKKGENNKNLIKNIPKSSSITVTGIQFNPVLDGYTNGVYWNTGGIVGTLNIDLYKGSTKITTVMSGKSNTGSAFPVIPLDITPGTNYHYRLEENENTGNNGVSADFEIQARPTISFSVPSSSTQWEIGDIESITWIIEGVITWVELELYKDGSFHRSIVDHLYEEGAYSWTIPSDLSASENYQIWLRDDDHTWNTYALSNNFEIIVPTLTINEPISTSIWEKNTEKSIEWSSKGSISNVKLELYKGGSFNSIIHSSTSNDEIHPWTIPTGLIDGSDYRIRITDVGSTGAEDYSEYFEICSAPSLTITNPTGLNTWETGTQESITWSWDGYPSNVKLELFKGGSSIDTIISSTINNGNYLWSLPTWYSADDDYRIKISDTGSSAEDYSDYFMISNPTISIISPTSSSKWQRNSQQIITWTSTGTVNNVEIQLLKNLIFDSIINSDTPNDGSYQWMIPSSLDADSDYSVKIISKEDSNVYSTSYLFEVCDPPLITITAPISSTYG